MKSPKYISKKCNKCDTILFQNEELEDEWVCHICEVIFLDWNLTEKQEEEESYVEIKEEIAKPQYISDRCRECNYSLFQTPGFEDDWVCHNCNMAYLDWPKEELDAFNKEMDRRIQDAKNNPEKLIPWEIARETLRKKFK